MTSEGVAQTICPYCCQLLCDVAKVTREHVLPFALGGSETIPACKTCNEGWGKGLEGRLLGADSWLTVIAQAAGYTRGWVNATYPTGQRALEHFGGRQGRLLEPHVAILEETPERLSLGVTLPSHIGDEYIEHVIRQQTGQVLNIQRGPAPEQVATVNLSVTADDLASLNAKVALCTGALRWGDEFLLSDLAKWLREGISDPIVLGELGPPAAPTHEQVQPTLESVLAHYATTKGADPWTPTAPSFTIMIPVDHGRGTAITLSHFGLVLGTIGNNLTKPGPVVVVNHFHPLRPPDTFAG